MESTKAHIPAERALNTFAKVETRHSSRPRSHSHLTEMTSRLSSLSIFGITVKQRAEMFQISLIEVCIFALIFRNDPWQADNVVTQLLDFLEVVGTELGG